MNDTVTISQSSYSGPDFKRLRDRGGEFWCYKDGECYKVTLNQDKGSLEPRITLSRNHFRSCWETHAEVSIGRWLHGSNTILPVESDIPTFLSDLSIFAGDYTGRRFDAPNGRIKRLDCTRDFLIGEAAVASAIGRINQTLRLNRYDWSPVNETIYFRNQGGTQDKTLMVYGKFRQVMSAGGTEEAKEHANGKLRLEVSLRDRRVRDLAKTMKVPYHSAKHLLSERTSEYVLQQAMKLMRFESFLQNETNSVERLFAQYPTDKALKYAGIVLMEEYYSTTIDTLPFIQLSPKTHARYRKDILDSGVSPH